LLQTVAEALMATRAEQFRANEERRPKKKKARPKRARPGIPPEERSQDKARAAEKATYALEEQSPEGRRSRRSTRDSSNRAKPDASFNLVEQIRKDSPESRFRKARARSQRARGSNAGN